MKLELRKTFQFEAAHLLPHLPKSHKCRRLHGHSFKVDIVVAGECDPKLGWVIDYAQSVTAAVAEPLKLIVTPLILLLAPSATRPLMLSALRCGTPG